MFEGGYREPCLMRFPGQIPAGTTCDELCSTIDLLPTIAKQLGVSLPAEHIIDGLDIWPLITGQEGAASPHETFYCYYDNELRAVRDQRWKLTLPHQYRTLDGRPPGHDGYPGKYEQAKVGLELFDLANDVGESTNVAEDHPEVVARLSAAAEKAREDLGDVLTGRKGKNVRPPGRLED
jgi:arylsulfatase A-like enzyme